MIDLVTISGVKYDVDEMTKRYVVRKISRLDKYAPRQARKGASAEIVLKEVNRAHGNKYEAEVTIKLSGKTITAKDSTVNALAAIDIVETKLIAQMTQYKAAVKRRSRKGRILSRLTKVKKIKS